MRAFQMVISKRGDNGFEKLGEVTAYYPLLSELGFNVEPKGFESYSEKDGSVISVTAEGKGFPQYDDDKAQYLFDSLLSAVKVKVRNSLKPLSAELKDGASIPTTVEELLATSERNGEAVKAYHECLKAFAAYLPKTGKSAAVCEWAARNAKMPEGLTDQSKARRDLMLELLKGFAVSITQEQLGRYAKTLGKIEGYCAEPEAVAESDLPE